MAIDGSICPDQAVDNREYPDHPIIGVGGLVFNGRSVLLIKRAKEPGLGLWSIPGGAVEVGETLAQGLEREMREEVGLTVKVGPLVEVIERIIPGEGDRPRYHYVLFDYLCFPEPGSLEPGSDASEACYVPPEAWRDYGLPDRAIAILNKAWDMSPRAI